MVTELLDKQRSFYESGNTLDTRSRRGMLQILANTVKDIAGDDPCASDILTSIADVRKHLYKWSGTDRLRLLLSLFARPAKDGPIPYGCVLIDVSDTGDSLEAIMSPLVSALSAGNTAVVILPDSPAGETARKIVDETFTDDFVATVAAGGDEAEALPRQDFSFVYTFGSLPCKGHEGFMTFSEMTTV